MNFCWNRTIASSLLDTTLVSRLGGPGSLRHQLAVGAMGSILVKLVHIGLAFVSTVLLARLLGPADYGVYSYAFALLTLMAVPTELGLPKLLVRQTAWCCARRRWGLLRCLLIRSFQAVGAASFSLAIVAGIAGWFLSSQYRENVMVTFWVALLLLPIVSLSSLQLAALRGLGHVVLGQAPQMILRPGIFVLALLIVALIAGGGAIGSATAMGVQVAASAAAMLVGTALLLRKVPREVMADPPVHEMRAWMAAALPFLLMGGMQIINSNMDMVMLGALRPAAEVGAYRIAVQLALLVVLPLTALNTAFGPHFARLWAQDDRERFQRLVTSSARAVLAMSLPIGLVLVFLGGPLVTQLFGTAFLAATAPLTILCGGQLVNAGTGSVGLLLSMTGHEAVAARALAVAAVANIVLNACLIPLWGTVGASLATALSYVVWNGYMVVRLWHRIGVDSTALGRGLAVG